MVPLSASSSTPFLTCGAETVPSALHAKNSCLFSASHAFQPLSTHITEGRIILHLAKQLNSHRGNVLAPRLLSVLEMLQSISTPCALAHMEESVYHIAQRLFDMRPQEVVRFFSFLCTTRKQAPVHQSALGDLLACVIEHINTDPARFSNKASELGMVGNK
eukprot:GHVS01010909.1.p1 GENE.GHVS01010909.1~~GHVS01010909.1.p1  ORF type:complete len:175 (-),score=13.51 GHVS01010909.1:79-561(-)